MPLRSPFPCRCLVLLAALMPLAAAAAPGRIVGTVVNQDTGDLLAGARIQLEGSAAETESERDGTFVLPAPAHPHPVRPKPAIGLLSVSPPRVPLYRRVRTWSIV